MNAFGRSANTRAGQGIAHSAKRRKSRPLCWSKELCPISTTTLTSVRRPRLAPDPALPSPPSSQEKYSYMGRQHRWLLYAQAFSFSLIAYSIARFATADAEALQQLEAFVTRHHGSLLSKVA